MDPVFAALRIDVERTRAALPRPLHGLAEVAWNVAWSWLPDGLALFRDIDAGAWGPYNHNPRAMLERVQPKRLAELSEDPIFLRRAEALEQRLHTYLSSPLAPEAARVRERYDGRPVAYFSAEFGLHESLPIYAGGLGLLAGDHLKSASDLGVPLVGVGLRYKQGYFYQGLDAFGWQQEHYRDTEFGQLPVGLILQEDGTPLTVNVPMHNRTVTLQIWAIQVGRVPLILLDSDREDNEPVDRWITGHLYGGNRDTRIAQEIVLGIGGVRALRALGYEPAVFHMNEGHAAFLGLELLREKLAEGRTWTDAVESTRAESVFTTHTPVPAGHDVFDADQVKSFLSRYFDEFAEQGKHVFAETLMGLGRRYASDGYEGFNMTFLAMHMSRSTNGVSRLHGQVSREMFHWLWPGVSVEDTPIGHVTNGVHAGTWLSPLVRELLDRHLGPDWERRQADPATWENVDRIPDEELWDVHCRARRRLVEFARDRVRGFRIMTREQPEYIAAAERAMDPDALTIGFARRVATYKRLGLLLHDPERALRLLDLPGRPMQFVIAGKAHPGDTEAKRLLQYLFRVRYDPRVLQRALFLVDYNVAVARQMVQGCDVWLNLPRRPLEASGTSGMKAGMNGVLNCSILDGWWDEGYNGTNGWAVGSTQEYQDTSQQDRDDAESLYRLLEEVILPAFYDRDSAGIPRRWVAMMKSALKSVGGEFNTSRMVGEYATKIYAP